MTSFSVLIRGKKLDVTTYVREMQVNDIDSVLISLKSFLPAAVYDRVFLVQRDYDTSDPKDYGIYLPDLNTVPFTFASNAYELDNNELCDIEELIEDVDDDDDDDDSSTTGASDDWAYFGKSKTGVYIDYHDADRFAGFIRTL